MYPPQPIAVKRRYINNSGVYAHPEGSAPFDCPQPSAYRVGGSVGDRPSRVRGRRAGIGGSIMPRVARAKSAVELKSLPPGRHEVGGVAGLILVVKETGTRGNWLLRAVIAGRRRELGCGEARNKAPISGVIGF